MTGAEPFSPGWFERTNAGLADATDDSPVGEPASAEVEVVITGVETGKLTTRWVVEGGRLTTVRPSSDDDGPAAASIPVALGDLAAIVSGERDAAVSFMRGDLKPEGRSSAVLALMAALQHPATRAALAG